MYNDFFKDFQEAMSCEAYARIIKFYERGFITFDEAFKEIYKERERAHKETVKRLRAENRAAARAEQ